MNLPSDRSLELKSESGLPLSDKRSRIGLTIAFLITVFGLIFGLTQIAPAEIAIGLEIAIGFVTLIGIQLALYRRTQQTLMQQQNQIQAFVDQQSQQAKDYQQTEALFSIFSQIQPRSPLPQMRDWAASPDFLKLVISVIQQFQPRCIVEAGSGVSTLISGYCLEALTASIALSSGEPRQVLALDHDSSYAHQTQQNILHHRLQNVAKALYAPLKQFDIGGAQWLWYDTDDLPAFQPIDLLIVDGPPWYTQPIARYPALPLLFDRLSDGAILLLDDADRPDEQQIIQRWQTEFPCCSIQSISTEKGACLIQIKK